MFVDERSPHASIPHLQNSHTNHRACIMGHTPITGPRHGSHTDHRAASWVTHRSQGSVMGHTPIREPTSWITH